ncbi:DUF6879 family protein [Streptomyces sp. NPDC056891]|uniref:DUF6879 family protein n=1 Tax=unclassified Streptomyces TaxID=2593676 RepID=UPI003694F48C
MARQLRFTGTDSKIDGCPALHTDEGTGEIVVQGTPITDPADLAQLQHFGPDEAAVVVPRELLVNDFQAFLATGSSPSDPDEPWFVNIRAQVDAGKTVGRVRIADRPPTTEQLFLLDYARHNAASGEDIRYLWREDAAGLPAEDFWIFDSRIVALLHFDDEDTMLDIELITEPAEVVRYCVARDAAMHHAVPYDGFAAQVAAAE